MLFIGLVLMGIFSYKHLPMELYPNAELPVLSVSISAETESDPSYIENQVAIPVEGAVSALHGVEKIETQIYSRGGQVTVSFKQDVDLKYTFLQLEERIKSITPNLPDNFRLNVNKSSSGSASDMFMNLRVLGEDDIDYVRNIADSEIVPYLENIDGIANVTTLGGRQKSIEVIIDPERCKALNITTSAISRAIRATWQKRVSPVRFTRVTNVILST